MLSWKRIVSIPVSLSGCLLCVALIAPAIQQPPPAKQEKNDPAATASPSPPPALELAQAGASEVSLPVADLERSKKFYLGLGAMVVEADALHASITAAGLSIRLILAHDFAPSNYPVLVWRFENFPDAKARLVGVVTKLESMTTVPGGSDFLRSFTPKQGNVFKDPDGHVLAFVVAFQH